MRFEETDTMQVVYYSKFFVWMEVGRVSFLRDAGLPHGLWEKRGFRIPAVQAHADYGASARFDDEVLVKIKVANVGRTSMRFENEICELPDLGLLCTRYTVHVLVDGTRKAVPIPDDLKSGFS